jgi:hypothetical protein
MQIFASWSTTGGRKTGQKRASALSKPEKEQAGQWRAFFYKGKPTTCWTKNFFF